MAKSQERVPVATRALKPSRYVTKPRQDGPVVSVKLGSNAGYAVGVHENPRAGKTGGVNASGKPYTPGTYARSGSWKYLEDPVMEAAPVIKSHMVAEIMATLREVVGPWRWIRPNFLNVKGSTSDALPVVRGLGRLRKNKRLRMDDLTRGDGLTERHVLID